MRDHDDGLVIGPVGELEDVHDVLRRLAVEVAGRLVAKEQRRVVDQRTRNADALLLTAGKLVRQAVSFVGDMQRVEQFVEAVFVLCPAVQIPRQQDVFLCGQNRDQVVELIDDADLTAAKNRELVGIHRADVLTVHQNPAACGAVNAADQVHERALAAAARADNRDKLALLHAQIDVIHRTDSVVARAVGFA